MAIDVTLIYHWICIVIIWTCVETSFNRCNNNPSKHISQTEYNMICLQSVNTYVSTINFDRNVKSEKTYFL